jgi:hypothetical protein
MQHYIVNFEEHLGASEIRNRRIGIVSPEYLAQPDNEIEENLKFTYRVVRSDSFDRDGEEKSNSVILMLHGLNERSWDKYMPWAEFLAENTGKSVVLFPISLHMDRSPLFWSDSRKMQKLVYIEREKRSEAENLTYVNYAISSRLKADPYRFYLSGRESVWNICQLMEEIKQGNNELISSTASVDIFGYSIGAMLAQVLMMTNPEHYFSDSKMFMFCGGSLFSEMNGSSKKIMDRESFASIQNYYTKLFQRESRRIKDYMEEVFMSHLSVDMFRILREGFYRRNSDRVMAISLKRDTVMPTSGIRMAMEGCDTNTHLEEFDFPFNYSHEAPFPDNVRKNSETSSWFEKVFSKAAAFFEGN